MMTLNQTQIGLQVINLELNDEAIFNYQPPKEGRSGPKPNMKRSNKVSKIIKTVKSEEQCQVEESPATPTEEVTEKQENDVLREVQVLSLKEDDTKDEENVRKIQERLRSETKDINALNGLIEVRKVQPIRQAGSDTYISHEFEPIDDIIKITNSENTIPDDKKKMLVCFNKLRYSLSEKINEIDLLNNKLEYSAQQNKQKMTKISNLQMEIKLIRSKNDNYESVIENLKGKILSLQETLDMTVKKASETENEYYQLLKKQNELISDDNLQREFIEYLQKQRQILESLGKRKGFSQEISLRDSKTNLRKESKKLNNEIIHVVHRLKVNDSKYKELVESIEKLMRMWYNHRLQAFQSAQKSSGPGKLLVDRMQSNLLSSYEKNSQNKLKINISKLRAIIRDTNFAESLAQHLFEYTSSEFM